MKKLAKFLIPLGAVALLASCSGGAQLDFIHAKEHAKTHYSEEAALAKYSKVKYTREVVEVTSFSKEVEGDQTATAKNAGVLTEVKAAYGIESAQREVPITAGVISAFFFNEAFLEEFNRQYSSTDVQPSYEVLSGGGMKAYCIYSEPIDDNTLQAMDSKEGGMAVDAQTECNADGCNISTVGACAVTVDVDGDGEVDVEYTYRINVSFVWTEA